MEDKLIITPEQQLAEYGQEDHVRLYGCDFKERFENYGFEITVYSPKNELSKEEIERYGLLEEDILMIANQKERF